MVGFGYIWFGYGRVWLWLGLVLVGFGSRLGWVFISSASHRFLFVVGSGLALVMLHGLQFGLEWVWLRSCLPNFFIFFYLLVLSYILL
jgi:hypothetical protein